MRLSHLVLAVLSWNAAGLVASAQGLDQRVLFAGSPDCERTREFAALLAEHFSAVEVVDYSSFTAAAAEGFDVVVLDYDVHLSPTSIGLPRAVPALPADYDRATVLIGAGGVYAAEPLHSKLDWL